MLIICVFLFSSYSGTLGFLLSQNATHATGPCNDLDGCTADPSICQDPFLSVEVCPRTCKTCVTAVDGVWADWSPWSCDVSCGRGTKTRTRSCTNPPPENGGHDCQGTSRETAECIMAQCPVNGVWTDWSPWSCDVSCGRGTRTRIRSCTNPPPAHGGYDCQGTSRETSECILAQCPVNGVWAHWSHWSTCDVRCGRGTSTRTRSCTNPPPSHGGNDCVGSSHETTQCTQSHNPGPSYPDRCTFDSGNLCGWQQMTTDTPGFDWTFHSGTTPSLSTGPNHDHTQGNISGKYIYIEASSPRKPNDVAGLVSHVLSANRPHCFTFWYTMYGTGIGTLTVSLEDTCTGTNHTLFTDSGNKGNATWLPGFVTIPANSVSHDYRIQIHGSVGHDYRGDMALDDLDIGGATCAAFQMSCNFDMDFCSWTQSTHDNFNWTRMHGSTSSFNTGPTGDHTHGNATGGAGFYIYTEATGRHPTDFADLISPELPAGESFCLHFYTNMYGIDMGSIRVMYQAKGLSSPGKTFASISSSTPTPEWREHRVNLLSQGSPYNVVLRGIIGSGFHSDAAIDDISMTTGACHF